MQTMIIPLSILLFAIAEVIISLNKDRGLIKSLISIVSLLVSLVLSALVAFSSTIEGLPEIFTLPESLKSLDSSMWIYFFLIAILATGGSFKKHSFSLHLHAVLNIIIATVLLIFKFQEGQQSILPAITWIIFYVIGDIFLFLNLVKSKKGALWMTVFAWLAAIISPAMGLAFADKVPLQIIVPLAVFIVGGILTSFICPRINCPNVNERKRITNYKTIIGKTLTVVKKVDDDSPARAIAGDVDWAIIPANGKDKYDVGQIVKVLKIEGVQLIVKRELKNKIQLKRNAKNKLKKLKKERKLARIEARKQNKLARIEAKRKAKLTRLENRTAKKNNRIAVLETKKNASLSKKQARKVAKLTIKEAKKSKKLQRKQDRLEKKIAKKNKKLDYKQTRRNNRLKAKMDKTNEKLAVFKEIEAQRIAEINAKNRAKIEVATIKKDKKNAKLDKKDAKKDAKKQKKLDAKAAKVAKKDAKKLAKQAKKDAKKQKKEAKKKPITKQPQKLAVKTNGKKSSVSIRKK